MNSTPFSAPRFKTLGAGVSDKGEYCLEEQLLGSWIGNWQNLLAEAKTFWFISVSIPDKSSCSDCGCFLKRVSVKECHCGQGLYAQSEIH